VYNRLPHSGINNSIPYEILFKSPVSYANLKVFGCKVFYYLPKPFRNKFENNALPGIFLGYSNNGYKILDITNNKIIYSRSVDFFENDIGPFFNTSPKYLSFNHKIKIENNDNLSSDIINSTHIKDDNSPTTALTNTYDTPPNNSKRTPLFKTYQITKRVKLYIPTLREPIDYNDIFNLEDKELWLEAVQNELKSLKLMNVYNAIDKVPPNANVISCRWVFKYKRDSKGNIIKRKARLVARGFTQQIGIDFQETFSPTLKHDSLRILTAISTQLNFNIKQIDINSAYLNAELEEDIYLEIPKGHPDHGKLFWKLKKALYGLKQAGKAWNDKINNELIKINFKRLKTEPCIYIKMSKEGHILCILAIYVDDILIAGKDNEIEIVKHQIKKKFNIKDIGNVDFVIGIKFEKYKNGYFLHQKRYINDLLTKYNFDYTKQVKTLKPLENEKLKKKKFDETTYRSAVGSLLYLAICTRPDILFAVSKAARKSSEPNHEDWESIIKIFIYLKNTIDYGILYTKHTNIDIYTDADYAGDKETRRSTSGFLFYIGGALTRWMSKLQHYVATSTAESEYYSLSECAKHCVWYINFLNELNFKIPCLTINVDNKAAIYNSKNQSINPKNKHIDVKYHYIRELISNKKIKLDYIKSNENLADGLTKYLNGPALNNFRNSLLTKNSTTS